MRSYDFYNLSEFAFEHLRDSRRTLAPLAKSFFFQIVFRNMIVPLPRSCSSSCSRRAPTVFFFFFFFFDTTNRYEVFLGRPKSHNLRTETKCRKLSPEGFCEIPLQKQSWGRQPPMKDKGKIGLDREELVRGETTLWMKSYYWTFISHRHSLRAGSHLRAHARVAKSEFQSEAILLRASSPDSSRRIASLF